MALFYHSGIFLSIASDDFIVCMFVYLFGSGASVAAVSSARGWHCDSVMALSSARGWHCDSVTAICSRRTAIRSCRGNLPSAHVRRCASVAAVSLARGWRCSSVAAVCSWRASGLVALLWWFPRRASGLVALLWWFPWRAVGDAALLRRFALGARPALWLCCGGFLGARPALWLCCGGFLGARLAMRLYCGAFLGARPAMRLCCDDLLSAHGDAFLSRRFPWRASGDAVLLRLFASVHACLFSFVRKKETACDTLRSYSAGSRSPFVRSRSALRLSALVGLLRVWLFICGDLDGVPRTLGTENGERGWRRGLCASLRSRIGTVMLSAGSTLGLRAPDCAKESSTLWTLLTLRRGLVGAYTRRHPGTRVDPPGSNLWPGGSCCIAMLSTRSNVQTRAAPKRRRVGLRAR